MSSPLHVTQRITDGILILELHGRVVLEDGDQALRNAVDAAIEARRLAVLVDLHDVSYIDSAGIGAVVEVYLRLTQRGGQCKLLRPSPHVQRVLDITRLSTVIGTFADESVALATFDHAHA
jgi:anti-sigma B factor antagonist